MRQSTSGRSTGMSNRFSSQPVDFKRYSVAPGTGSKPIMAAARFAKAPPNRNEQAQAVYQFFKERGASFTYTLPAILNGPTRGEFRTWFEYILKAYNRNIELSDKPNDINDEVPAILACLNYPQQIKNSTMISLNARHAWPHLLTALHWLVELVEHNVESAVDEYQDVIINMNAIYQSDCLQATLKYAIECYKKAKTGDNDFAEILNAVRECIVGCTGFSEVSSIIADLEREIAEADNRIEIERNNIAEGEREIASIKQETEKLKEEELLLCAETETAHVESTELDDEAQTLQASYERAKNENATLTRQVERQPISALVARELLQKRDRLRTEAKEKKARMDRLLNQQIETNKQLTRVSTEKTEAFRKLCHMLGQWARQYGVEAECREYERALFINSTGADSLRAENLNKTRTTTFRTLVQAMRKAVDKRFDKLSEERLGVECRELDNKIREQEQKLKQLDEKSAMRLERSQISISEAAKKVKQAESDCMTTRKAAEEAYAALQEMHERTLKQAALMRDIDTHAHKIDEEETQLVAQFADYMLHVSTRFTQAERENMELVQQKQELGDYASSAIHKLKLLNEDIERINRGDEDVHSRLKYLLENVKDISYYDDPPIES